MPNITVNLYVPEAAHAWLKATGLSMRSVILTGLGKVLENPREELLGIVKDCLYNQVNLHTLDGSVKTAVSIPDDVHRKLTNLLDVTPVSKQTLIRAILTIEMVKATNL